MAMTETSAAPQPGAGGPAAAADEPVAAPAAPAEASGLAGWLSTSDHKRVGRLWLATSLLFLLVAAVLGELLAVEGLDSGADVLKDGTFAQVFTLHHEALALLFVVPFFLGLATYLVPLQVGSPEIAFPRGSATAFWGYVVSALLLCASYAADGGITGTTPSSVDLYLLSLVVLAASLTLGAISVVTTVITMRAPGMTMLRTPMFSWSVLVGGGLLLLQLPILAARLIGLFIPFHFAGDVGDYEGIAWTWSLPGVYVLVVMVGGVILDVVTTLAGRALRFPIAGIVVLALLGVRGIGGWLVEPEAIDDLLYVGIGLFAVVPPLALLGTAGDAARMGSPKLKAPLVLAMSAGLLLLLGGAAGAVQVIEPLELAGTAWETGTTHLVLLGAGALGAFAALWFWAPKIWGAHLSEGAGFLVALLLLGGSVLVAAPDLVTGASEDLPRGALEFEETDVVTAAAGVEVAGAALAAAGAVVGILAVLGATARRRGTPAVDDPWGGFTLEWTTTSPPPPHNFEETPEVPDPSGKSVS